MTFGPIASGRSASAYTFGALRQGWRSTCYNPELHAFFLLVLLLACSSCAFADTLYAVDGFSHLWTIDTTTGAATEGPALSLQVLGDISWLNGTLYGGSAANGNEAFSTIDPTTGIVTVINGSIPVQSLAAIPSLSEFYDVGSTVDRVDIITSTGSIAQHFTANSGQDDFVNDLAYDSLHGVLYATDNEGDLDTIDLSTGDGTTVGHLIGTSGRATGPTAYDWNTGTLYALIDTGLYSVNTDTGVATLIGSTGMSFSGFADLPVPEPSTAALIATGVAGFVLFRSRLR